VPDAAAAAPAAASTPGADAAAGANPDQANPPAASLLAADPAPVAAPTPTAAPVAAPAPAPVPVAEASHAAAPATAEPWSADAAAAANSPTEPLPPAVRKAAGSAFAVFTGPGMPVSTTSDTAKIKIPGDPPIRAVVPVTQIQGVKLIGPRGTVRLGLGTFKIGRAVDADVRLEDRQVSRAHAILIVQEKSIIIEDLKTVNGTLVNAREIRGRQTVNGGDILQVGESVLKVEVIQPSS
jgi:hypothetical protein